MLIKLGVKKVFLNTFHLSKQIFEFIKKKNFSIDIQIIRDGEMILDTGGGILNMINNSKEKDFDKTVDSFRNLAGTCKGCHQKFRN